MSRRVESSVDQESLGVPEDASKYTAGDDSAVPTTNEEITLAQTLIQITTATTTRPKDKGVVVQEP
ncbi:hypothetical protein Tco_0310136, partial [Tanacetum coccineum]